MRSKIVTAAALIGVAFLAGGCATNPATGDRELSLIGEQQEISMGRQADQDVQATIGVYDDPALEARIAEYTDYLARVQIVYE